MSGGGPQGLSRLSQCLPCGRRVLPGLFQLAAVHVGRDGVRRLFQRIPRPGQCIRQGLSRLSQRRFVAAVPQNAGDLRQRVGHVPEGGGQVPGGSPNLFHGLLALEGAAQGRAQMLQRRQQAGNGLFSTGGRPAEGLDCRPQLLFRLISQPRCRADFIQRIPKLVGQVLHQVHHIDGVIQDRRQLVDEPGDPGREAVELLDILIGPVRGGVRQIAHCLPGLVRPGGDGVHPV